MVIPRGPDNDRAEAAPINGRVIPRYTIDHNLQPRSRFRFEIGHQKSIALSKFHEYELHGTDFDCVKVLFSAGVNFRYTQYPGYITQPEKLQAFMTDS